MEKEIFKAGTKIDIKKINPNEKAESAIAYRSQIYDTIENGRIKIEMPTYQGKLILLQLGGDYSLVFFAEKGMYECRGKVTNRYKANNMIIAEVDILSQPKKIQRREYFRMDCIIEAQISRLTQDEKGITDDELLYKYRIKYPQPKYKCMIVDISGGGARIVLDEKIEHEEVVFLEFGAMISGDYVLYKIRGKIINQEMSHNNGERYELRVEFINMKPKVREELIRYIFETERRKIKNEKS